MKKKIKIKCILKSGQVVKDSFLVDSSDSRALEIIEQIRTATEDYLAHPDKYQENAGCLAFGKSTVLISEIAAISFKD